VVRKSLFSLVAALLGALLVAAPAAAAENGYVVVRPDEMHGWGFVHESGGGGNGQMVFGPAPAPLGVGSAQLTLSDAKDARGRADGWALGTLNHNGTTIASIISLDYSTYTRNNYAVTVQLAVSNPADSLVLPGYHRLVFEPSVTPGSVQQGTWQRWSPTGPLRKWWFTNNPTPVCTQVAPCTWTEIRALFAANPISEGVFLKAGSGWPANSYNVDAFLFIAAAPWAGVLYDFEPETNGSD
jgi:hypothetical protein